MSVCPKVGGSKRSCGYQGQGLVTFCATFDARLRCERHHYITAHVGGYPHLDIFIPCATTIVCPQLQPNRRGNYPISLTAQPCARRCLPSVQSLPAAIHMSHVQQGPRLVTSHAPELQAGLHFLITPEFSIIQTVIPCPTNPRRQRHMHVDDLANPLKK